MKIPIFNCLYDKKLKSIKSKLLNIEILNNLNLRSVDIIKFSFVKILNKLPKHNSMFETLLITVNDYFVYKFLNKKLVSKK